MVSERVVKSKPKRRTDWDNDCIPPFPGRSRRGEGTDRGVQDKMADMLDEKTLFEEFRKEILPKLREAAKFSDVTAMLEAYAPYAVVGLMDMAQGARKEEVRLAARIRLLEHATGKPVQRNLIATKNLDDLPEKELEALLKSELKRLKDSNLSLYSQFLPLVKDKEYKDAPS